LDNPGTTSERGVSNLTAKSGVSAPSVNRYPRFGATGCVATQLLGLFQEDESTARKKTAGSAETIAAQQLFGDPRSSWREGSYPLALVIFRTRQLFQKQIFENLTKLRELGASSQKLRFEPKV
jgi:hypothetical protein